MLIFIKPKLAFLPSNNSVLIKPFAVFGRAGKFVDATTEEADESSKAEGGMAGRILDRPPDGVDTR